ncbi:MAG: alpha/beta hydrolase [Candidatus Bathyarchaeota archaeon]|nr:alpha/beta hydrolase [Candidatus Bathyarchaeota archaeon]
MEKEILSIPADGVDLYCEKRGSGPLLILVTGGTNDCEPYTKVAEMLSDEFTVIIFDMRGGTRSMPRENRKVTPKMLAGDVAAIIKYMNMGKASVYGCSSGGQTVLALGLHYPELVRNMMVHEAALMSDTQIPGIGFEFFRVLNETFGSKCVGFSPVEVAFNCNVFQADILSEDCKKRLKANGEYWARYYLGSVDVDSYSKEDLDKMPNLEFTIGAWTPSHLSYANITTAERGGKPYKWLPCAHVPHLSCPDVLVDHIISTCKKYM